jgi:hypothetical protein
MAQRTSAGFQYPKATGKYDHPWMKQLPPGRARVYDILYMSITTVLAAGAAYGFFETARGTYYILAASRQRSAKVSRIDLMFQFFLMAKMPPFTFCRLQF